MARHKFVVSVDLESVAFPGHSYSDSAAEARAALFIGPANKVPTAELVTTAMKQTKGISTSFEVCESNGYPVLWCTIVCKDVNFSFDILSFTDSE